VIAAASAAAPAAAGAAGIAVRIGAVERHLSPEEVTAAVDRPAGTYLLRAPGTSAEPVAHPPALSVRRLVQLAGGSPDALTFVSIERPNGTLATLGPGDVSEAPPFAEGPPIVWIDSGGTRYLRPLRGDTDANAADNVGVTSGDLAVRVHQGPLLSVRADADRRSAPARESVGFGAEVTGAAPGVPLTYEWTFGDGASKQGDAVRHVFQQPGVYEVVVSVSGGDDSGGSSAPLRIRVGEPRKGEGSTGGGDADRRRAPAQGPAKGETDGSGSGRAGAPGSGRDGADARASGGAGTSTGATGAARPAGAPPSAPRPPRRAAARRPRAATTPSPPATSTLRPAPRPRQAAQRPASRPARGRRRTQPQRPPASGRLVSGTLVSSSTATRLSGGAAAPAGAAGSPAAARQGADPRKDAVAPVAGALMLAALLWLGVRRERRDLRPREEAAP
jgi:PKD repeat protein